MGRSLANCATTDLRKRALKSNDSTSGVSGFKNELVDHQGSWAHAVLVPLPTLVLKVVGLPKSYNSTTGNQRADEQFGEDRGQLFSGIWAKQHGQKSIKDGNKEYDVDVYIAEKHSEINDDKAGEAVAEILRRARTWSITWGAAEKEIKTLLCDH